MLSIQEATSEKQKILSYPEKDSSRMYFWQILRYVNITEYESVLDNIKFFLNICPKSMDKSKNMEFWKYLKGYLFGLRYVDDDIKAKIQEEDNIISTFEVQRTESFYLEIRRFLEKVFLPTWLAKWENK